jgi:epoxyqueuosine reductase
VIPAASAKRITKEYAWDLGIDGLGICDAEPLAQTRDAYEAAVAEGLIPQDSAPRPSTIIRLTTPEMHLKRARSVVSAFQYYYAGEVDPGDLSRAVIAPYTRSNFYLDLKLKLQRLAAFMQAEFGCRTKVFSCYVTLAEKPLAAKAGIGFYGKHGVIITPEYGSFVVLGEIITDLALDRDGPLGLSCGACTRCMDECPTGAITEPYMIDRNRCIQYLSERRGVIPHDIREAWRNRLYGCSTCQDVCPHNSGLSPTSRQVMLGLVGNSVSIRTIMDMDEAAFRTRFRRNAVIAAGNSESDSFLPRLKKLAVDRDPMIRLHSLWAISRIAGKPARRLLDKALKAETDPQVVGEIKSLLD